MSEKGEYLANELVRRLAELPLDEYVEELQDALSVLESAVAAGEEDQRRQERESPYVVWTDECGPTNRLDQGAGLAAHPGLARSEREDLEGQAGGRSHFPRSELGNYACRV